MFGGSLKSNQLNQQHLKHLTPLISERDNEQQHHSTYCPDVLRLYLHLHGCGHLYHYPDGFGCLDLSPDGQECLQHYPDGWDASSTIITMVQRAKGSGGEKGEGEGPRKNPNHVLHTDVTQHMVRL